MDYESICGSLQTVRAARMFYEYGKLNRLLERGITASSDDLYQAVWTDIEAQKMYALTSSNTALDVVCGIVEKVLCFSSY